MRPVWITGSFCVFVPVFPAEMPAFLSCPASEDEVLVPLSAAVPPAEVPALLSVTVLLVEVSVLASELFFSPALLLLPLEDAFSHFSDECLICSIPAFEGKSFPLCGGELYAFSFFHSCRGFLCSAAVGVIFHGIGSCIASLLRTVLFRITAAGSIFFCFLPFCIEIYVFRNAVSITVCPCVWKTALQVSGFLSPVSPAFSFSHKA